MPLDITAINIWRDYFTKVKALANIQIVRLAQHRHLKQFAENVSGALNDSSLTQHWKLSGKHWQRNTRTTLRGVDNQQLEWELVPVISSHVVETQGETWNSLDYGQHPSKRFAVTTTGRSMLYVGVKNVSTMTRIWFFYFQFLSIEIWAKCEPYSLYITYLKPCYNSVLQSQQHGTLQ